MEEDALNLAVKTLKHHHLLWHQFS